MALKPAALLQKECLISSPRFLEHPLLSHGAVNALHVESTQCCHLNAKHMPCIYCDCRLGGGDAGQDPPPTLCHVSLLSAHQACDRGRSITTCPDIKPMTCEVSDFIPKL